MTDVLRVDIMLKEANTNLKILEQKVKPLQTTFNKLLNRNENEEILLDDSLRTGTLPELIRKDSLLNDNPVLSALDLKIEAGKASEKAAYRQGLPKLGFGFDYVIVGERTDMVVPDNGKDILMPMLSVSIPVFRKKYAASVMETQMMQESYAFQKKEYSNTLTSSYEMAWFEIQQQFALLQLYQQQTEESRQILDLLFSAYSNAGKEFEEVLRMEQQLLKYEKMKATAWVQYQLAIAKINYLTAKKY